MKNLDTPAKKPLGFTTASAVVIANMIGTGVFAMLSYQVHSLPSVFAIMMLWLVGGLVALCGALSYGELGAALPRSGGEYHFLSRIYHPMLGFLSGWVSIVVGFAAPVAAAAIVLAAYFSKVSPGADSQLVACMAVLLISAVQMFNVRAGGAVQSALTAMKVGLILVLIFFGLFFPVDHQNITLSPAPGDWSLIFTGSAFAISLVYVSFAYSGWNAAAYIAGEMENPQKNLPRALLTGTIIVTLLYLGLNYVFLYTVPISEIIQTNIFQAGSDAEAVTRELAIAFPAGRHIFGDNGAYVISAFVTIGLLSTISAMAIAGPRVTAAMGEDFSIFRAMSKKGPGGAPYLSILLQTGISIALILTSTFQTVIDYIGFTLAIFASLTVLGVFVLRFREPSLPRPFKTPGYPVTPLIFLAINAWMIGFFINGKPVIALAGLGTIASGLLVYFLARGASQAKTPDPNS